MIALKRVLVPTDFSETSLVAVKYGVAFARAFEAQLHLLHVAAPEDMETILEGERVVAASLRAESGGPATAVGPDTIIHSAEDELLGKLLTTEERARIRAQYVLRSGDAYPEIVRYGIELDIDLIVIGTGGRGAVAHMLLGSVAEKLVRKAPCPVLTVRHPEHEFVVPDEIPLGNLIS